MDADKRNQGIVLETIMIVYFEGQLPVLFFVLVIGRCMELFIVIFQKTSKSKPFIRCFMLKIMVYQHWQLYQFRQFGICNRIKEKK